MHERGASQFFCTYVLPGLLEDFRGQNPDIELSLTEGDSASLKEKLLDYKLDFTLEVEKIEDSNIEYIDVQQEL